MAAKNTIAVTGAAGFWGGWLAQRLHETGHHVLALDSNTPPVPLHDIEFAEIDLQNPLLADLFESHRVGKVLHLDFQWDKRNDPRIHERNVAGTRRLLEAAVAANVRQVVLKSSILAYGARSDNPAYITENHITRGGKAGYARQLAEIEEEARDLRTQDHAPILSVLRFAYVVGPQAPTLMNDLLKLWAAPTLLGFDPLIQLVHENDVAAALEHALDRELDGPVNIAAQPPIPLARLMHLAGILPIPLIHPFAYATGRVPQFSKTLGQAQPIDWDYLRYPVIGDTTRMADEFLFAPAYDTDALLAPVAEQGEQRRAALRLRRGDASFEDTAAEEVASA